MVVITCVKPARLNTQVSGLRATRRSTLHSSPATNNPIVVQKFYKFSDGIEGPKIAPPGRMDVNASPSPARNRAVLSYSLPRSGDVSLVVHDAVGRPVQTLASGRREAGRYTATWDARDAAAGVYFYTLTSGRASLTRKIVLAD